MSADEDFVEIIGTDPSSYPDVDVSVSVDSDAGRDGDLTEDDFEVYEDGERVDIVDFEYSASSLDLAFVFDDSGSMGNEISAMKRGVKDLTEELEEAGIDARYGLVSFRDDVDADLTFTDDPDSLKDAVDSLEAYGGGDFPEDNFDAIATALEDEYREDAQKVIVDITDAESHYDGDGSGFSEYTLDDVAEDLNERGASFIAVSPGYDDPEASLKVLADETDGLWIDIADADFDEILDRITREVIELYVLRYETAAAPGGVGEVGVEVEDPDLGTDDSKGEVRVPEDAGPTVPREFEQVRDAKIEMSGQISSVSKSIDEQPRIESILDDLERGIENGDVDADEAISAVERMILGEDLTELSLGALSPGAVSTGEDQTSLVGEPADSPAADESFDIAGALVQKGSLLLAGLFLATSAFSKVASWTGKVSKTSKKALEKIEDGTSTVLGALPWIESGLDAAAGAVSDELDGLIADGVKDGNSLYDSAADTVKSTYRDPLANDLMANLEGGFEAKLKSFDRKLGAEGGEFEFEGTDEDANEAAKMARNSIVDDLETVEKEQSVTGFVSDVSSLMGIAGSLLSLSGILAPVGAALGIVGAFFSLGFSFLGAVSAADGLFTVRKSHNDGLDAILTGGV
ncbi:MAG: vWA domain-containing protein [Natrinema limicola]